MALNCAECAGYYLDWRPLASSEFDNHERRGRWQPFADTVDPEPSLAADVEE